MVSMPSDNLLKTDNMSAFSNIAPKKRLRDYKEGEIKRDLPAVAQGTYGIVYKGTVKVIVFNLFPYLEGISQGYTIS